MKTITIAFFITLVFFSCNEAQTKNKKSNLNEKTELVKVNLAQDIDTIFDFSVYEMNKLPKGWSQYYTARKGENPRWELIKNEQEKGIAQLSEDNPNRHYNEIVYDGFKIKDCEISVKLKALRGRMDQGGGLIWRFTDANNYYVVRANPLEDNVVLYKVKNGKRTDLPILGKGRTYGVDVEKLGDDWNELKLIVKGNIFIVYLNNKEIFKVEDNTFTGAGKVGFWTKADAVTIFKDLKITTI